MFLREKRSKILLGIFILLVIGSMTGVRNTVESFVVRERQMEARTTLNLFYENLSSNLENFNYAERLSYVIDEQGQADEQMFSDVAQKLLKDQKHIVYLAYFEGDILKLIFPRDEYGEVLGKNLRDFSYSFTLAKVIRTRVIEGPEQVGVNKKNVFLFIYPFANGTEYKGEIVAAIDRDYVIGQMGLEILQNGGYDYELWRVNALGEHKIVIAASDENADFSEGVKVEFNLPSTWTLSITPREGWFSLKEEVLTDLGCIVGGVLLFSLAFFVCLSLKQKESLKKAKYTEPDSGLYNLEGFCSFVDRRLQKNEQTVMYLVYIQLTNLHKISLEVSREETLDYFVRLRTAIQETFPEGTLAARLGEEDIAIALFEDKKHEKLDGLIEEFVLRLIWKQQVDGKKEFVDPKYQIVSYPMGGPDAASLLKKAEKTFHCQYGNKKDQ